MSVTAQFEFDRDEYQSALRETWAFNPGRWVLPVMGIVVPAVMLWVAVGQYWGEINAKAAIVSAVPWLMLSAFYLSMLPLMQRAAARRALENDPALRGVQVRTVDEAGVQVVGAGFAQQLLWADLVRAVETDHFFLFFYNKRVAHYLPKRVLTESELHQVRVLITAHGSELGTALVALRSA
jgi:hypothetical protein